MHDEYKALKARDFEYYNVIQLRGPAHVIDSSLPLPPPAEDYADGSWTDWLNADELNKSTYFKSIVDFFCKITKVTLVRLLRLAPHSEVREHTDPTMGIEVERSVIRLTIPIITSNEVTFYLNGVPVLMQPGECWYLKLTDPHRITNYGDTERVNLTIDMVPNDLLRQLIEDISQPKAF
ncbi:Aspartyl/Asparaginyl beta-hydroxylase [Formosa sp. Hel1_31_208]|uniref:aspartyl/asparaginyl beta-hydroxylase domain-containing protein n=1 Tax=Formosa sp. Hel1_31_208 TaxID=1798225 RepID=UPI00087CB174|nr:aspartyl/asparaginyl beta-hydroxylase domain-containing protein [Formosa sp. Hel1_31_208]SDS45512.1 Aspartyl/Asparaginyl beta-hydroxylase [Formosa sp. Hel1_31_208]